MNTIDIEPLLREISPDAPSGEVDLMGDPDFVNLEIKVMGTPEREFDGKIVQEAKGPDWPEIKAAAVKLLSRTHDLRVAVILTRALLHTDGFNGLATGLALLNGLVRRYWDSFYPQLDPEDDFDPMIRNTILETLSLGDEILGPLKRISLCTSPVMGQFNYRDILIAGGKLKLPEKDADYKPDMANIEAAFKDTDTNDLSAQKTVIGMAIETLAELEKELVSNIGDTGDGPDLRGLQHVLVEMDAILTNQLDGRMPSQSSDPQETVPTEEADGTPSNQAVTVKKDKPVDMINNRQDVIRLLDKICNFYQLNEPGSPVPLLLKRARQLVDKNFMEIIQDLAPDSTDQFSYLTSGAEEE